MHTTLNTANTSISEEHRDGDRYLVAKNVAIVRPQSLSNGYVPEKSVANSVEQENTYGGTGWDGLPATLNHARNLPEHSWYDPARPKGQPVVAANVNAEREIGVGQLENDRYDGEYVRVDIAVNADEAEAMGGEAADVVDALENEESLDVSTHYVGAELPPGEYDGEQRDRAEAIVAPDALALLPNKPGQCSVEDGCGIDAGPTSAPLATTANDLTVTVNTGHSDDGVSPKDGQPEASANATEDPVWSGLGGMLRKLAIDINEAIGMWKSHDETMGGDGELPRGDADLPDRATVNVEETALEIIDEIAAENSTGTMAAESAVDTDELSDDMKLTANASGNELRLDLWADMMADVLDSGDEDSLHVAYRLLAAEMPGVDVQTVREEFDPDEMGDFETATIRERISDLADTINNPGSANKKHDYPTSNMDRDELIKQITANSAIKQESLEGMGDTCLQTTYDSVVANNDGSGDGSDGNDADGGDDDDDDGGDVDADGDGDTVLVQLPEEHESIDEYIDAAVEQRVAANEEQRTKEQRVERIVANSAEYDGDDKDELMETPESVLDRIESGLNAGISMPGASAPTVNAAGGASDDVDLDELGVGTGVIDE